MKLFLLAILALAVAAQQSANQRNRNFLCEQCDMIVELVSSGFERAERIAQDDIPKITKDLCKRLPKLEFVNAVCQIVQENISDAIATLLHAVQKIISQGNPCKVLCSK